LAVMAGFFTLGSSVQTVTQAEPPAVLEGIGSGVFLAMFLLAIALGVATLRTPGVRTSSLLLTALVPVIALTVLLGVLGSDFAHPGYAETLVNFGVALLGFRNAAVTGKPSETIAEKSAVGASLDQRA